MRVSSMYALAARPQGVDPATITTVAVAVVALVGSLKSLKGLLDGDNGEAVRHLLNDSKDRLEDIARTDPRLREFMDAITQLNRALKIENNPGTIMRAVNDIAHLADTLPACEAVMAELRAAQFQARQRCSALYEVQQGKLERALNMFVAASGAHIERLRDNLADAEAQGDADRAMHVQRLINESQGALDTYERQCAELLETLRSGTESQLQQAFAKASTLRVSLRLARERERSAYEQLAATKTTLRQPPPGSRSTTWTRPHGKEPRQ